jgi:hypothetical protein
MPERRGTNGPTDGEWRRYVHPRHRRECVLIFSMRQRAECAIFPDLAISLSRGLAETARPGNVVPSIDRPRQLDTIDREYGTIDHARLNALTGVREPHSLVELL